MRYILPIILLLNIAILQAQNTTPEYTMDDILEYLEKQGNKPLPDSISISPDYSKMTSLPQPGVGVKEYLRRMRIPGATMIQENVAEEAAKLGWGTSRWDKGEFTSGMTKEQLERKRAIERKAYYERFFTIIGISLCAVVVIVLSCAVVISQKRRKNPWQNSSFSSDY